MSKYKLIKSKYIGVYKLGDGFKPWFTHIRFGKTVFKLHSDTEIKAGVKYDILSQFLRGNQAVTNNIITTPEEYKEVVKELLMQITLPTEQQKMISTQGIKKYTSCSSIHVGVYKYHKLSINMYYAYICKDKKRYSLGYYKTEDAAGAAYNVAATYLYLNTKKLNDVDMSFVDDKFIKNIISKIDRC